MSGEIRVGVIGAGPWGQRVIASVRRLDCLLLTRVASRNANTPSLVGSECFIETDWRAVVQAHDVEAVVVTTPPAVHAEIAAACILADKAVLVEKPLVLQVEEAKNLLRLAESRTSKVLVDHVHLYSDAYREIKAFALAGFAVERMRSVGGNFGPFRPDTPPLWDYGSHDVAMCVDLAGENPSTVSIQCTKSADFRGARGALYKIQLEFPGGARADLEVGNLMEGKRRLFEADFGLRMMTYDDTAPMKLSDQWADAGSLGSSYLRHVSPMLSGTMPLDNVLLALADAVRADRQELSGLKLGLAVTEVLAECQRQLD